MKIKIFALGVMLASDAVSASAHEGGEPRLGMSFSLSIPCKNEEAISPVPVILRTTRAGKLCAMVVNATRAAPSPSSSVLLVLPEAACGYKAGQSWSVMGDMHESDGAKLIAAFGQLPTPATEQEKVTLDRIKEQIACMKATQVIDVPAGAKLTPNP